MENVKKRTTTLKLLPQYFKIVGLVMVVLAFVPVSLKFLLDLQLSPLQKNWCIILTIDALILGLFFIAFSKDKVEDELTFSIRLNSMAAAFGFAAIYVIVRPIIDFLLSYFNYFKREVRDLTAAELVLTVLLFYLTSYYLSKRRR